MNPCIDTGFYFYGGEKIMVDLKIEQNEHIIRRTREAWSYDGDEERELQALVLTNENLISVYEKSVALFFKGETVVDKKPLSSICIIDGILQVKSIMDNNFGESLQILYNNGAEELYFFGDAPQSEYQQWENAIKKAVIESNKTIIKDNEIPVTPLVSKENKQSAPIPTEREKEHGKKDKFFFCTSCGEKNNIGARFCQGCGIPLRAENNTNQTEESRNEKYHEFTYSKRRQEYAGKIIKCPNCGEILGSFVTVCPLCGYELRGANANDTLKELLAKLEVIDLQPDVLQTEKEKQKIALIRNFPIPNTREDLLEFLVMASSNVDTEHIEGWDSSSSDGEKALSEAWKAKYEQAYHKAKISFRNPQEFQELNKTYLTKMKKYERKTNMAKRRNSLFWIVYFIGCIFMVCFMFNDNSAKQKAVDAENERLELILGDIQKCIEEGEYIRARSLNATLVFNVSENLATATKSKKHWDDLRNELYDIIENAEKQDSDIIQEK